MNDLSPFAELLDRVREKHGTLSNAFRAAGLDPDSRAGKNTRRLVEKKINGDSPVKAWDVWALRGLLSLRKRRYL